MGSGAHESHAPGREKGCDVNPRRAFTRLCLLTIDEDLCPDRRGNQFGMQVRNPVYITVQFGRTLFLKKLWAVDP